MTARLGRRFAVLLTSSTIANVADGVLLVALPLLAATLTRDPLLVAGAAAALRLPWLLCGLLAGVLVDRFDRRRVMIAAGALRAGLVGLLAVLVAADGAGLVAVYVLAFGLGVAETVYDVASRAVLPDVVAVEGRETANARLSTAEVEPASSSAHPWAARCSRWPWRCRCWSTRSPTGWRQRCWRR